MAWRCNILLFLFISMLSCKQDKRPALDASSKLAFSYMDEAKNSKHPLVKRLAYAIMADSILTPAADQRKHLASTRLIATLYLKRGNNPLATDYFKKTISLATQLGDDESRAVATNNLALCFASNEHDSAVKYYDEANLLFKKLGNDKMRAQSLIDAGILYKNIGSYEVSFRKNLEAIKILESFKDTSDLGSAYITIGSVLRELSRTNEALVYYNKALRLFCAKNDSTGIAAAYNNIGTAHLYAKNYDNALLNYGEALKIKERQGNSKAISNTLDNIAQTYLERNDLVNAETIFNRTLKLRILSKDKEGYLTTANRLAKLYIRKGAYNKAEAIALQAHDSSTGSGFIKQRLESDLTLFEIYSRTGNNKSGALYVEEGLRLKDSLFNYDMSRAISQMSVKYRTEQTEKELFFAKEFQMAQSNQIHYQRRSIILLCCVLLLLIFITFLLFRSNRQVRIANNKIETLLHELNHRTKNNLQIISDMLSLQLLITKDATHADLIQSGKNRVESMNIIHMLLYKKGYSGTIEMKGFINALVSNLEYTYQDKSHDFTTSLEIKSCNIDIDKAIPIGLITNELLTNIYKYSTQGHENVMLKITFGVESNKCKLQISDNGPYWNIQEIKAKKKGLGLFLVETLVNQLKGTWSYTSNEHGTTQIIEFLG